MSLVATNKITEYINKHQEARITLLTWLKEYPYRQEQNMFLNQEGKPIQGHGAGNAQPDLGFYSIKYRINCFAKAVYITNVGTRQEQEEEAEREFKELQQKDPSLTKSVKVADVILKSPPFEPFEQSAADIQIETDVVKEPFFHPATHEKTTQVDWSNGLFEGQSVENEAAYQQALLRVNKIFDAQPDTPEFAELLSLLFLVGNYEKYKLKFLTLQLYEVVLHRMKMFNISASDLATMLGSADGLYPFLFGEQVLPPKILARVFKLLGIRFPVDDQRFI